MSAIKNSWLAIVNGEVDSVYLTQQEAEKRTYEIAWEWKRESDLGSDARPPRLAVLSFTSWMQLQRELAF